MAMARLRVEGAGLGADGCWMASCLLLVFLSDSCNFLGCEIMQTEVHPAIKFCCLGFFSPLFWVPLIWSAFRRPHFNLSASRSRRAAALTPRFSFQLPAEKHPCRGAAVLPCKKTHAGPERQTSQPEQWLRAGLVTRTSRNRSWGCLSLVIEKKKCLGLAHDVSVAFFTAAARRLGKR